MGSSDVLIAVMASVGNAPRMRKEGAGWTIRKIWCVSKYNSAQAWHSGDPGASGGSLNPGSDQLPDDLKALVRRNALELAILVLGLIRSG